MTAETIPKIPPVPAGNDDDVCSALYDARKMLREAYATLERAHESGGGDRVACLMDTVDQCQCECEAIRLAVEAR